MPRHATPVSVLAAGYDAAMYDQEPEPMNYERLHNTIQASHGTAMHATSVSLLAAGYGAVTNNQEPEPIKIRTVPQH